MANQLKKKFIGDDQIDGSKILLDPAQTIRRLNDQGGEDDLIAELENTIVTSNAETVDLSSSYTDAQVSAEAALREAGDAAVEALVVSSVSDLATMIADGDSSTLATANYNLSVESGLRETGDQTTLSSANQYTDGQIAVAQGSVGVVEAALEQEILDRITADSSLQTQIDNVLSNVDGAALDSLTEIVEAFQAADDSLNGAITSLSTGLSADIAAEELRATTAENNLSGRIDTLEGVVAPQWISVRTVVGADTIVDGFFDLPHDPIGASLSANYDRLAIFEVDDFIITNGAGVDGGARITFVNELLPGGNQALAVGDFLHFKFQF
jgi:hypothetical protein